MAIGLGRMFGFHFLENFNYPYVARSVTEFWRRWHISLSTWFRDYVYIPLGGNRCSRARNVSEPLRRLVPDRPVARRELELSSPGDFGSLCCSWGKSSSGARLWSVCRRSCATPTRWCWSYSAGCSSAPRRSPAAAAYFAAMFGSSGVWCGSRVVVLRAGVLAGAAVLLHRRAAGEAMAGDGASKAGRRARPRRADVGPKLAAMALLACSYCKLVTGSFNPFIYFRF